MNDLDAIILLVSKDPVILPMLILVVILVLIGRSNIIRIASDPVGH